MLESAMCYNYILHIDKKFKERFALQQKLEGLKDKYSTSPLHEYPVITRAKDNQLELMNWGLTPSWAKTKRDTIVNVRAETIAVKDMFKDSFANRRCLIPATAFTEWKKDSTPKQQYIIKRKDNDYLAFAGIFDENNNYAIITTTPNQLIAPIHNRMPVILNPEDEVKWLTEPAIPGIDYLSFLRPYSLQEMEAMPIIRETNRL